MATDKHWRAICSQVSKTLRQEREKRGLSMTVLGERAGLSQQAVSYIEREMRIPNLDTLLRIAEVLEIDLGKTITEAKMAVGKGKVK